jgi:putative endonuclease
MAQHNELGKKGEDLAVQLLREKGYTILETNYRFLKAEVDIIATKEDVLIAVEVKTRSTPEFGDPQDFLKPQQIKRLVKAVDHYVNEKDLDVEVRFDIVAIIKNKLGTRIEHLEDAFLYFD